MAYVWAENKWCDAFTKYTKIAFNQTGGAWCGVKRPGCKHLFAIEPYIVQTTHYELDVINKYETYLTWNKKFAETYKDEIDAKIHVLEGGVLTDNIPDTSIPNKFTPYDKKIKGVIIIGRPGKRKRSGSIYFLKSEMADKLSKESSLVIHTYSAKHLGGSCYQGVIPGGPWGKEAVERVDKYLFNFCPENTYHPMWSYGYLCEKIFRAFKARTVPIYLGCFNVEDYIPKDLFIDFRDFYVHGVVMKEGRSTGDYSPIYSRTDYKKFAEYLENFPKEKYIEMTEKAFEWQKARGMSNYIDFINLCEGLH